MKEYTIAILSIIFGISCYANDKTELNEPKLFEISFGTSQMFNTYLDKLGDEELLPTTSALFLAEYKILSMIGLVAIFNLPLEPFRKIVNGQLESSFAAPSTAFGFSWIPIRWFFKKNLYLETQLGLLGGLVIKKNAVFFPLTAFRIHLVEESGFTIYLGSALAFRLDTTSFIYGIGHRF